jgi:hypothetical protein
MVVRRAAISRSIVTLRPVSTEGRSKSIKDAADQTAMAVGGAQLSNATAVGGVFAATSSQQLVPGSNMEKGDMEIDTAGVHAQKQCKLAPYAEAVICNRAGMLGAGPSAGPDPVLNAMHQLTSQSTNFGRPPLRS